MLSIGLPETTQHSVYDWIDAMGGRRRSPAQCLGQSIDFSAALIKTCSFANPVIMSDVDGSPRRRACSEVTERHAGRQVVAQPLSLAAAQHTRAGAAVCTPSRHDLAICRYGQSASDDAKSPGADGSHWAIQIVVVTFDEAGNVPTRGSRSRGRLITLTTPKSVAIEGASR